MRIMLDTNVLEIKDPDDIIHSCDPTAIHILNLPEKWMMALFHHFVGNFILYFTQNNSLRPLTYREFFYNIIRKLFPKAGGECFECFQ